MTSMTARAPAKPGSISTSDIDEFARNGFLYVPRCFSVNEMRDIARWTQDVQDREEVPGRHMAYYEDSVTDPGGDHRAAYYADKRKSFPPDTERVAGTQYRFRV